MEDSQNHILFVEDHDDTRELVTLVLKNLNCRVTTSSSIEEGLKLAHDNKFDLYMLDSWLTDGSGVELCKRLRQFDTSTPIMFLSAAAYEADRQMAISSGAQCYLVKPADINVLGREAIALIMHTRKSRGD